MWADLRGRRVLLAYGLFGEVSAALRRLGVDYMHSLETWLKEQGAAARVVPLDTLAPVAGNALRLAEALAAEADPALVIGYSKGGVESLAALTHPQARAHCRGFVALQAPFLGSPVADAVVRNRPLAVTATTLARLLGIGSGEGLHDLTTDVRRGWMARHAAALDGVIAEVPTVCVAARLTPAASHGRARLYLPTARWMERQGFGPNDGLVPVSSALLGGARHLAVDGCHIASISGGGRRDPVGLLRRALAMLDDAVTGDAELPGGA